MTVEAWKSLFDVLTVALLGLTFLAGAGVLITGNIIGIMWCCQLCDVRWRDPHGSWVLLFRRQHN